jgi:hypothetical protein
MDYVDVGVEVWVCGCHDWYDGPRKVDVFDEKPATLGDSFSVCHGWACGWIPREIALDVETSSAIAERDGVSPVTVYDLPEIEDGEYGSDEGAYKTHSCCPDCGGTLYEHDDYSVCEYVDEDDDRRIGLVACGFTEGVSDAN